MVQRDPPTAARISERVRGIKPQRIRVMFDLAAQQDGDLVHLELGEPDFDTPEHIVDAAAHAARTGHTKYTANAGIRPLREAITETVDPSLDPDREVIVTSGGVEALHLAIHTVANPGEEIVIPTPAWPNPISQARLAGANPVEVAMPASDGFAPDPDPIVDAIGPDTAAVVVTSPSNPTGQLFPEPALEAVLDAAVANRAYVIADEVYRQLTYVDPPQRAAALVDNPSWVVSLNSCSKTYAMTGWRVGWLTGPADVVGEMTKIHESTTSCVNTPAQHGAIAALTGPTEPVDEMKDAFHARRDFVVDRLQSVPHVEAAVPEGAFYAFVDVSALPGTSMDIAKQLLREYEVVTAPGDAFGAAGEDHVRLSFANERERLALGLDRFERMIQDSLVT